MKRHILLAVLTAAALTGCYEDKGSYDYSELQTITVGGFKEEGYIGKPFGKVPIEPEITPADGDYEYAWVAYVDGQYTKGRDTIATTRNLTEPIELDAEKYKLMLIVKDKKTGYYGSASTNLSLESAYERGWYILKEKDGATNLDVVTPDGHNEDLLTTNNDGYVMPGKPLRLMYLDKYYDDRDEDNKYITAKRVLVMSDEELISIKTSDGTITRHFDDFFYRSPEVKKPQDLFHGANAIHLINDGVIHSMITNITNTGRFVVPFPVVADISTTRIATTGAGPVLWNRTTSSFMSVHSHGESYNHVNDQPQFLNNDTNCDLLFMGGRSYNFTPLTLFGWALLKDRTTDECYIRMFNARPSVYNGAAISNFTMMQYTPPADVVSPDVKIWATSLTKDLIYYVKDGKMKLYDIHGSTVEELFSMPAGEEVTFMHNLVCVDENSKFDRLAVATHANGKYKIYLYKINSTTYGLEDPEIIEGTGRVAKMMYVVPTQSFCADLYYNFD